MSDQTPDEKTPKANVIFQEAEKLHQEIAKAALREERKVIHQNYRTDIYVTLANIIREQVK